MPDSMMMAPMGLRLNVSGSSIAIAATEPMPGSTPISVPNRTPMKPQSRWIGETAVATPSATLGKRTLRDSISVVPPEESQRQLDAVDKDREREHHHHHGERQDFEQPEPPARRRAEDDDADQRRHEADMVDRHAEGEERQAQHDHGLPRERRDAALLHAEREPGDGGAQHDEHPTEPGGEIAGTHAHRGAHGVVAGDDDRQNAEADEHQPGPEIFLVLDA